MVDDWENSSLMVYTPPFSGQCLTTYFTYPTQGLILPYGAYISRVFNFANFANLESFAKFIQRKFEPLRCNTHGQHEFAKFIQRIP